MPTISIDNADNEPLVRATYSIFVPNITPAATPTDLFLIQGSASRVVRLKSLLFAGVATSATNITVNIVRRTADNTGGTRSAVTTMRRDFRDQPATAVVYQYTANPTLGASPGILDGGRLNLAPAANGSIDRLLLQYTWQNDKAIVLRGVSDFIAINLGGAAWPAGGALDTQLVWTEDNVLEVGQ